MKKPTKEQQLAAFEKALKKLKERKEKRERKNDKTT